MIVGRLPKDIDYQGRFGSQEPDVETTRMTVRLIILLVLVLSFCLGYFLNTPLQGLDNL